MNQRTANTVLAALRYWQRDLSHGDVPDSLLEIARDGGIEELSIGGIDYLCEKICERGVQFMGEETSFLEQAIFRMLDEGFSIYIKQLPNDPVGIDLQASRTDQDNKASFSIRVSSRVRLGATISLLARAAAMSRTT